MTEEAKPVNPLPPLLEVRNLSVHYDRASGLFGPRQEPFRAVDGIGFTIPRGKTLGVVGESGSGKSSTGKAILRLAPVSTGSILFEGREISTLDNRAFFPYRQKIQMIFQDPYNSLNPHMTIEEVISEPLEVHFRNLRKKERREKAAELLSSVSLTPDCLNRYPHAFSGGQRQRIGIARALACQPEFIVCDEPVSALDVSVQAEIVNLLQDLQQRHHLTYLFIAHDLAVVEHISDEIVVMHRGKIVEHGNAREVCSNPRHPYTQKLLEAVPQI